MLGSKKRSQQLDNWRRGRIQYGNFQLMKLRYVNKQPVARKGKIEMQLDKEVTKRKNLRVKLLY